MNSPSAGDSAQEPLTLGHLSAEEYVEQAHLFGMLGERLKDNTPAQEALATVREEVLATTKLPMAIGFMLSELQHGGFFGTAMAKLPHYFTAFQSYVVQEGENDRGRFDLRIGLAILKGDAEYRAGRHAAAPPSQQGLFLYQFEAISRNRLGYDRGLAAVAEDPAYDGDWRAWILKMRHKVGMVDFADLLYVSSEHYRKRAARKSEEASSDTADGGFEALFGDREGRIALANRRKDPMLLFNSLHRQLGYPEVPRPEEPDEEEALLPQVARRLEQLEKRVKILEEEQRGGIDLSKFYQPPPDATGL